VARTLLVVVIGSARIPRLKHPVLGLGRKVAVGNADSLLCVLVTVMVRVDSHHSCEAVFFADECGVGFEFTMFFRRVSHPSHLVAIKVILWHLLRLMNCIVIIAAHPRRAQHRRAIPRLRKDNPVAAVEIRCIEHFLAKYRLRAT